MIGNPAGVDEATAHLAELIRHARIRADALVTVSDSFPTALWTTSATAAIVFLGFVPPAEGSEAEFIADLDRTTTGLTNVILVSSSGDMQLDV